MEIVNIILILVGLICFTWDILKKNRLSLSMIALAGLITFLAMNVNVIFAVIIGMTMLNSLIFKAAIILGYERKNKNQG